MVVRTGDWSFFKWVSRKGVSSSSSHPLPLRSSEEALLPPARLPHHSSNKPPPKGNAWGRVSGGVASQSTRGSGVSSGFVCVWQQAISHPAPIRQLIDVNHSSKWPVLACPMAQRLGQCWLNLLPLPPLSDGQVVGCGLVQLLALSLFRSDSAVALGFALRRLPFF